MALYRDGFPEDSSDFREYFFDNVLDMEEPIYREENGEIISCGHIVNKRMKYYDSVITLPYLVAVSTLTPYRGHGKVENVIYRALERADSAHIPFVALHPFSHDYYKKYSFVTVDKEYNVSTLDELGGTLTPTHDIDALYGVYRSYEAMHDICVHRDRENIERRVSLLDVDAGDTYIIENNGNIAGYVMAYDNDIEELVVRDNSILDIENKGTRPNIMMRVVDVCSTLRMVHYCDNVCTQVVLRIVDRFYVNRLVLLDISDGKVDARLIDKDVDSIPSIDITVEELTLYVLGISDVEGLPHMVRSHIHLVDKY